MLLKWYDTPHCQDHLGQTLAPFPSLPKESTGRMTQAFVLGTLTLRNDRSWLPHLSCLYT